jgi:hypothetical protein
MPTYFFHVREGADLSQDGEGQELPDLESARTEAVNAIRELIGERVLHGGSINCRQIEIADKEGDVLAVVQSSEVIFREGQFRSFGDDVTKSAPVAHLSREKPPSK